MARSLARVVLLALPAPLAAAPLAAAPLAAAPLAVAPLAAAAPQGLQPTHADVVYATAPVAGGPPVDLALDIYLPSGATGPVPCVVWIHGGGWQAGSKGPAPAAGPVAAGYAVASIDYRLSGAATWPAQLHDCKAAVRFLRANAATYGLDPERFGAWGSSAGAHLAACLGTTADVGVGHVGQLAVDLEGSLGAHVGVSSRVQAVAAYYPPTNFLRMDLFPVNAPHDDATSPESKLVGVAIQLSPEATLAADPTWFLSGDDAPARLVHGTADPTVPYDQSEHLWRAATLTHGLDWELVAIPDGGHGGPGFGDTYAIEWFDAQLAPRATTVRVEAVADAAEGGAAGAFRVVRSGSTAAPLTVAFAQGGTAEPGRDVARLPQRVVLPAGVAERLVAVTPLDDAWVEGAETVTAALAAGAAYAVDPSAATATVTVVDDEVADGLPVVSITAPDRVAIEGTPNAARVRIARTGSTAAPLEVAFRVRGVALPGVDHDLAGGATTIAVGQAAVELSLSALADDRVEPSELFVVELLAGADHALAPARVASGRVSELASALPRVGLYTEAPRAAEGGDAAVFVATRTGSTTGALAVPLALSGTATPGVDVAAPPAFASFAPGERWARVTLDVLDDAAAEGLELADLAVLPAPGIALVDAALRRAELADDDGLAPTLAHAVGASVLGRPLAIDVLAAPGDACATFAAGAPGYLELSGAPGLVDVGSLLLLFVAVADADGVARGQRLVPDAPALAGAEVFVQSVAVGAGGLATSPLARRRLALAP